MEANNTCSHCGEPRRFDVAEIHTDERTFTLDACCELTNREALELLEELGTSRDPQHRKQFAAWWLEQTGRKVRQLVADLDTGAHYGGAGILVDEGFELCAVTLAEAKAFVREHHRHASKPPCGWRWGHGLRSGGELIAVAMVGRPVARLLDHTTTVEVNRLCVAQHVGRLGWNACSKLYAAARREAKRRGFATVITYTLEEEQGTTLRAAGFAQDGTTRGGSWSRAGRARSDKGQPLGRKIRWTSAA